MNKSIWYSIIGSVAFVLVCIVAVLVWNFVDSVSWGSTAVLLVAVPVGWKVFNWLLYRYNEWRLADARAQEMLYQAALRHRTQEAMTRIDEANAAHIEAEAAIVTATVRKTNAEAVKVEMEALHLSKIAGILTVGTDNLPIRVDDIETAAAYALVAADIQQRYQPRSITTNNHGVELVKPAGLLAGNLPDFWQMYVNGLLPNNAFYMGNRLEDGQQLLATWKDLYSALIVGQSGSGKSTLVRLILAQAALQNGQFYVLDPHFAAGEESLGASLMPLGSKLLAPPAATDIEMLATLKLIRSEAKARLQGKPDRTPIILVADELMGLLNRSNISDVLLDTMALIAQETRKVNIFCMGMTQQATSTVFDTSVRNSFVSYLGTRARKDVLKVASGNLEFARLGADLTVGQAVWMKPTGELETLAFPNVTQKHLEAIATQTGFKPDGTPVFTVVEPKLLTESSLVVEPGTRPVSTPVQKMNIEPETVQSSELSTQPALTAQEQLIIASYKRTLSVTKTAEEIFGSATGNKKIENLRLINETLAKVL